MFNRETPVAVLKSGLVVSQSCPVLGASPDAKVKLIISYFNELN